jgi:lipoate---protein ligase
MRQTMDFINLGTTPWADSQTIYHALAYLGREALVIVEPASPYVCIGFHQDAAKELNLELLERERIPVFRREVGGGAVYLDRGQLFYQFILRKDNPLVPRTKEDLFRLVLQPVVATFQEFGVPAEFKPVNDILAQGKKISGNGAAEIGDMLVVVGNFIIDFNFEMMSKVLRVPDEKFRDKVFKTLQENLTTIPRVTGKPPPTVASMSNAFRKNCEMTFGSFVDRGVDAALRHEADAIFQSHSASDWVFENDHRERSGREVKIAEGVYVAEKSAKFPGGLVRISAVNDHGYLRKIHLSGDFFFFPQNRLTDLELVLEGQRVEMQDLQQTVKAFYQEYQIESPGITPDNISEAISALSSSQ